SADTCNPNGAGVECYYIIPPNNNIYHTLCFNRWSGRYLLTTGPSPRPGKKLPLLPLPVVNNGNNTSSSGNNNCQDVKLNGVTIQGLCR
ncbi:MAG: hypothetical protein OIF38_13020, partial [Cellvibrionaceae bacterium]|nr:hypothetical protein [Cellvibrionaceae bacterium]